MRFIVVMGSPGSGKTTFSNSLADGCNEQTAVISCGDLYRNHHYKYPFLESESAKGKEYWIEALKKFIILALKDEIANNTNAQIIIIDGLWGDNLETFQREIGHIDKLYYIECTEKVARSRLFARNRSDDHPAKIRSRLTAYFDRENDLLDRIHELVWWFVAMYCC